MEVLYKLQNKDMMHPWDGAHEMKKNKRILLQFLFLGWNVSTYSNNIPNYMDLSFYPVFTNGEGELFHKNSSQYPHRCFNIT